MPHPNSTDVRSHPFNPTECDIRFGAIHSGMRFDTQAIRTFLPLAQIEPSRGWALFDIPLLRLIWNTSADSSRGGTRRGGLQKMTAPLVFRAAHPPKPGKEGRNASGSGVCGASRWQTLAQHQLDLSEARQAEAIALYTSGAPVKEIARRFDIHHITVSEICKRHGIGLQDTTRRTNDGQVGIAARRYRGGASLATIGKELGANTSTVWNRLIKVGVEMRPPRGK